VLGILLYRSIVRPVRGLTDAVRAVTSGDLDLRIPAGGIDELAALGRAFNEMTLSIGKQRTELLSANAQLAVDIEARANQLRVANDSLRSTDARRTQLLADVSHELRTPLTILRGETDVALRGQRGEADLREALEHIQGQARDLTQLLEDLMAFARADAENHPHKTAVTRLDDIISAAAEESEVLAEPREVSIVVATNDGGCRIDADFRRLKQALIIGLDNAIKHSPPGSKITLETAVTGGKVTIRILDEGSGIAAEDQPHVFERFYRGRKEGELLNQGIGIGLAIAKEIVERHDGTIALDNRPEGGAALSIVWPLAGATP
jgi:signal transduction histidine kinase